MINTGSNNVYTWEIWTRTLSPTKLCDGTLSNNDGTSVNRDDLGPGQYYIISWTGDPHVNTRRIDFDVLLADLDVDSDNNDGINPPQRSDAEENAEETDPGKFMMVNHNDDDRDGIPDCADSQVLGESSLIPVRFAASGPDFSANAVSIAFDYPGDRALSSFAGKDMGSGFTDYTAVAKAPFRLWHLSIPDDLRDAAHYIEPGKFYTPAQLGCGGGEVSGVLYLEAAKPSANSPLTMRVKMGDCEVKDVVTVTSVAPNLGVNNSNSGSMRPGVPDVAFDIDQDDEWAEDQGGGFNFWWSRESDATVTDAGIVDLAPMLLEVPQTLLAAGFKCRLKSISSGGAGTLADLYVYGWSRSEASDRKEFLRHEQSDHLIDVDRCLRLGGSTEADMTINSATTELLFKLIGSGNKTAQLTLSLVDAAGNLMAADSVLLTMKPTQEYWLFMSTRMGFLQNGIDYNYPTELDSGGRLNRYKMKRHNIPAIVSGNRDPTKNRYVIFFHGYNTSQAVAAVNFNEMYRRLFWIGFRGNFIGITWNGDPEGPLFEPAVENALRTSPAIQLFLRDVVRRRTNGGWKVKPQNLDLMAHSLGNLVMWDALRLEARMSRSRLVRSVISFESAVWADAFAPESSLSYHPGSDDAITYSVDELKHHSWQFWLNPNDASILNTVVERSPNSFVKEDTVLTFWLRANDLLMHGGPTDWHYNRDRAVAFYDGYRGPPTSLENEAPINRLPNTMLTGRRKRPCALESIRFAAGNVSPEALGPGTDACSLGWGKTGHSDWLSDFWKVHSWYERFLGDNLSALGSE